MQLSISRAGALEEHELYERLHGAFRDEAERVGTRRRASGTPLNRADLLARLLPVDREFFAKEWSLDA